MANGNLYQLTTIPLTANAGGNTAQIQVLVTDSVTSVSTLLTQPVINPGPTVQAHIDALVTAALAYLTAKYPGATFTLPPAPPPAG